MQEQLGFGVADRRTVVAVLFTLIVSKVFLGGDLPFETNSPESLFVGLVLVTGYIYVLRVLGRLVLAASWAALCVPFSLALVAVGAWSTTGNWRILSGLSPRLRFPLRVLAAVLICIVEGVFRIAMEFVVTAFAHPSWDPADGWNRWGPWFGQYRRFRVLSVLDRLVVIVAACMATLPFTRLLVPGVGSIGLATLLFVFVTTGKFTFVVKDSYQVVEEEKAEHLHATKHPEPRS